MEQADEHRCLCKHRKAAHDRVEAVLFLQLLHLDSHPLLVLAVLLLQRFDLRLQFLHLPRRANLLDERLVQKDSKREDEEHHGQRPCESIVGTQHGAEDSVPHPENPGDRIVNEIEHGSMYSSVRPLSQPSGCLGSKSVRQHHDLGISTNRVRVPDPTHQGARVHI